MKGLLLCLVVGALLRLGLYTVGGGSLLANSYEINTPVNSFKRLREAVWLKESGKSPYSGSIYHNTPLMIKIGEKVVNMSEINQQLFCIGVDMISAVLIYLAVRGYSDIRQKDVAASAQVYPNYKINKNLSTLASFFFMINPFAILNCVAKTTQIIDNLIVFSLILFLIYGNTLASCISMALAVYQSPYYAVMIPPAIVYLAQKQQKPVYKVAIAFSPLFVAILIGLIQWSYNWFQSWEFAEKSYWFVALAEESTPNIGLFWYFFTEMFAPFRTFFMFVAQYHVFIYALPVTLRFRNYPIVAIWINLAIVCAFKAYPAVGDIALYISLVPIFTHLLQETQYAVLAGIAAIFLSVLMPITWRMWVWTGTGNANFYYALTLAIGMVQSLYIVDIANAVRKREFLVKQAQQTKN